MTNYYMATEVILYRLKWKKEQNICLYVSPRDLMLLTFALS